MIDSQVKEIDQLSLGKSLDGEQTPFQNRLWVF